MTLARRLAPLWVVLVLSSGAVGPAFGQESAAVADPTPELVANVMRDDRSKIDAAIRQREIAVAWNQEVLDQAMREDHHFTFSLYKQAVIDVLLTVLVFVIISAGLSMSLMQIRADLKAASGGAATSLKVSRAGIELSSSVIGLFVLLASMFFFYVYIDKVYEIRRVSRHAAEAPTAAVAHGPIKP